MTVQTDVHRPRRKIRCAIYTRKSTDEGLEQDFNSLDAQREACEAYVVSQKAEGWVLVPERFDDGGLSGGTLERPALHRLLEAIDQRQIDQIIVYKIDRLTRSLSDFSKIVDRLDAVEATFVSVTQSFNTATSMGRLTLNMLLSFAQFEREVTAERIRDKIAASKKKGLWMGGSVPLGYLADGRTLKIDPATAPTVARLVALYRKHRSISVVMEQAKGQGLCTRVTVDPATGHQRGGNPLGRAHIHQILSNPIYAGRIRHHKAIYDGLHPALIAPDDWDTLQTLLSADAVRARGIGNTGAKAILCGKIYDEHGKSLTPSHTAKAKKRRRYYISRNLVTGPAKDHPDAWRLPAVVFEARIAALVQERITDQLFIARLLAETDASALQRALTCAVTAAQQLRIALPEVTLRLVERIDLNVDQITVTLDIDRLANTLEVNAIAMDVDQVKWRQLLILRRRGVETRIIIGNPSSTIDHVLLRNIYKARQWYNEIISGKTYVEVINNSGVGRGRFSRLINLAFLAPDLLAQITTGNQPISFTSEWIKANDLPAEWDAQRALFKNL